MDDLQWIIDGLKQPGKTRAGLAKALKRAPSAITNMLNGKRALKASEIKTVQDYLAADHGHILSERVAADLDDGGEREKTPVVGYVGAASKAHFYAVSQGELERVPAPDYATARTVAVEIRGKSLGPFFDRWLVFYDDVRSPITDDLIGALCVVGLNDDRILIKKVAKQQNGNFTLYSQLDSEPPIKDAIIAWAARVRGMTPRS